VNALPTLLVVNKSHSLNKYYLTVTQRLPLTWCPTVARNQGVRVSRGVAVSAPGMFSKRPRSNQGCEGGRSFPNQSLQDVILGSSCILTSCRLARILNLQQKWYTSRFHLRCPQTQFNMGKLEHE